MKDKKAEVLERKRQRYVESVGQIQETARKLTEVGRLMEACRRRLAVSTDRNSLEYWLEDGEHGYLTSGELERLSDLVGQTHFLGFEIQCIEEELSGADR